MIRVHFRSTIHRTFLFAIAKLRDTIKGVSFAANYCAAPNQHVHSLFLYEKRVGNTETVQLYRVSDYLTVRYATV